MADRDILIVEDEGIIALDIQTRLNDMGYGTVARASNSFQAIEMAMQLRPDIVLMDIRLEGNTSGIEAADQIRVKYQIPVIYVTAHADEATIEQAKRTRPYGYILKPFKDDELRAAIEIALYRFQAEKSSPESDQTILREIHTSPGLGSVPPI
ncbi:MAG: response regulator, partial [Chloroflexi bacterium]|nr:response regulator [Chloroflexota bacterium]